MGMFVVTYLYHVKIKFPDRHKGKISIIKIKFNVALNHKKNNTDLG